MRSSAQRVLMAACLALSCHAAAAQDRRPRGVVELFTSEGCRSCPPADAVLADLARRGDVVALAYHVDYWDYLGWRDTLASARNTARQRRYAAALGGSVYTPQAVVNGRTHVVGSQGESVREAIGSLAETSRGLMVDVALSRSPDSLIIDVGAAAPGADGRASIVLVTFVPKTRTTIRHGENGGETIDYVNSVTDFRTVGMWRGTAKRIELPHGEADGKTGYAVLLQEAQKDAVPGPILGAALAGWSVP